MYRNWHMYRVRSTGHLPEPKLFKVKLTFNKTSWLQKCYSQRSKETQACWLHMYFADVTIMATIYKRYWGVKLAEFATAYISSWALSIELKLTAYGEGMFIHLITTLCTPMLRISQCPEGRDFSNLVCLERSESITDSKLNSAYTNFWSTSHWIERHGIEICQDDWLIVIISQQNCHVLSVQLLPSNGSHFLALFRCALTDAQFTAL